MPGLVGTVLGAEHIADHGSGLKEAAHVIAIIEELLIALEGYVVYWILGDRTACRPCWRTTRR